MEFRKLRLSGFKSFVEPVDLMIEPGLTGVVGPNGCGKSNLLEALRWVMGEGSPKSMRSGGMDDVIFAGTAGRPSREVAQVTLSLAGAAGEEVEVSRRIERGDGSEYRLNGRDARAQDVRLLFADSATGAHSPAIVGQGRISAIIAAKPAERRQLLEEAAGIAGLAVRRREAEIRLRAAEANVARLDDVVRALETQAASLKRQARTAERYRAISDRLKTAEASLIFARWQAARRASEAATAAAAHAEAMTGDLTRAAASLSADAANASADLPALRMAEAQAAAAVQALRQSRALLDAEAATGSRREAELAQTLVSVARDDLRESGLADDARTAETRLAAEAARLQDVLAAGRASAPAADAALSAATSRAGVAEAALSAAVDAHAAAAASARAAGDAAAAATTRLARAQAEARDIAARLARLAPAPDTGGLIGAVDLALAALAESEAALAQAEAARPATEAARAAAASAASAAAATLASLGAEADALGRRLAADTAKTARIADRIETRPGHEAALAAALGDDLDAAPADAGAAAARRWAGAPAFGDDPPLPAGVPSLAAMVTAPPELSRRLAQIGLLDGAPSADLLAALRPGQRLVTLDGALWRWDGLVDAGGRSDAAAARLRARRRAAELESEMAAGRAQVADAAAARAVADAAAVAAQSTERAARAARDNAARTLADARARLAAAQTAQARQAGEEASLKTAAERSAAEHARLAAEADAARAAVPDAAALSGLSSALVAARSAAETARSDCAAARAALEAVVRESAAAKARMDAIAQERAGWQRRRDANIAQQAELASRKGAAEAEQVALAARKREIAAEIAALASRAAQADAARADAGDKLAAAESAQARIAAQARAADEAVAAAREARATARAEAEHQEQARAEVERLSGERFQCPPPVLPGRFDFSHEGGDPAALAAAYETLSEDRERLGPVNLRADIELKELESQAETTAAEKQELDTAIARLRGSIGSLNREGRQRLQAAFTAVDAHFRVLFADLFGGGEARLALIESDDPLEAGLEIMAQPPGKKLQSLTLLSGGEQALTATALIFALFLSNPAPICVLDEVDAPLDDANVERFCDLLDRMAAETRTRFLIVTHNAVTMSRMHRLFGVTMGEPGVSQLVSVDLQAAEKLLATA
ncbi:AAA family ATPase [Sandarakinorhabdus sp.]|uniref:chromosome segregation SMC family protein n=1 Tax=Sandarakinorhabdus sp. TaxID=1916663 RepID=UPI00286DDCBD|nr:AAA family ATPase [Sandarakinorhabdus sp.]